MSSFAGKRLLILGGSQISCEIVNKAKEMGIYTFVTDWYPIEKSPAKQIADKALMISTTDIEAIVELIQREQIDGVITGFTDSVLPYYALICERAGLPCYGTYEQFNVLIDKSSYKPMCRKYGVPIVEDYDINEVINSSNDLNIKYPVLVKPSDASGGKGISVCYNQSELLEGYKKALQFSERKQVLVERYIRGEEVTVFYILQDGEIYLATIANRHIKQNQPDTIPLPVAYTFPSVHIQKYKANIEPNVKKMFQSLKMKNGMVFMQCLVEDGECLVYDIGYRLTGTLEYKLFDQMAEYNTLEMLIHFAITGKMSDYSIKEKIESQWKEYACNVSFLVKPGKIRTIKGVDKILSIPGVLDAVFAHKEGSEIPLNAKGTLKQILLRVFATSPSQEKLEEILNNIYEQLEVVSTDDEQMLLAGFDTTELRGKLT
ncbi:ATP-binding protein [Gracilibacillus alcaliphilus]|uniref:ATP-binding protein n=1 Tax=Gracilibacillus alcaliphilus TaxID=1401441 RepID=UPI0019582467|nr:ATP-grasp domain-containing protein [Gracilibacillus alcaliphilus]MBM7678448.1 biotin carboxylase [Gracilibacillus alcaliphilus]